MWTVVTGGIVGLQFTEDLVGSVEHVLAHRQELKGWTRKKAPGTPTRVQALAAHLLSEMKLPGKCPAILSNAGLGGRLWPCSGLAAVLWPCSESIQVGVGVGVAEPLGVF